MDDVGGSDVSSSSSSAPGATGGASPAPGAGAGSGSSPGASASGSGQASPGQPKPANQPAPPTGLPAKVKLKLAGKEEEWELDKVIARAQINESGYRKFEEAKRLEAEYQAKQGRLKTETDKALREAGVDPDAWAEQYLIKKYQLEAATPEQRELAQMREENERIKAEVAQREEESYNQQVELLKGHYRAQYENEIIKTLTDAKVKPSPTLVRQMALKMDEVEDMGGEISWKQALDLVNEDLNGSINGALTDLDGDALLDRLGKETVMKIVNAATARLQAAQPNVPRPPPPGNGVSTKSKSIMTPQEFREKMERIKNGEE